MLVAHAILAAEVFPGLSWEAIAAGLGCAGLAFAVGRMSFRRSALAVDPGEKEDVAAAEDKSDPSFDPFVHGSTHEQRRGVRRKGGQIEILISDEQAKAAPSHGCVLDRSTGGLRLRVEQPVPTGTVLTVRTVSATKVVPWLELEVKSCREGKEGWELGCQFLRPPPLGLLLMFG